MRFKSAHDGQHYVLAPVPSDHLHADGQPGTALLDANSRAVAAVPAGWAIRLFAPADPGGSDDSSRHTQQVVGDGLAGSGEELFAAAVCERGQRMRCADESVEPVRANRDNC